MLAEYATPNIADMIVFNKINMPEFPMIFNGMVISLAEQGLDKKVKVLEMV